MGGLWNNTYESNMLKNRFLRNESSNVRRTKTPNRQNSRKDSKSIETSKFFS